MIQAVCDSSDITNKQFSLLQSTIIFKFMSVIFFSNLADRKKNHKLLIGVNLAISSFALLFFTVAKYIPVGFKRKSFVIFCYIIYNSFTGGVFSILDTLSYNIILQINKPFSYYGKLRVGGTLGNMAVHTVLFIGQKIVETKDEATNKKYSNTLNLLAGFIAGICGSISCLWLPKYRVLEENLIPSKSNQKSSTNDQNSTENIQRSSEILQNSTENSQNSSNISTENLLRNEQNKIEENISNSKNNDDLRDKITGKKKKMGYFELFSTFRKIYTPLLVIYSLAVLIVGVDRAILSTFLTRCLEEKGVPRSLLHMSFLVRHVPEFFIYYFSQYVEKIIGIHLMFALSVCISAYRSLFFAFENCDYNESSFARCLLILFEILKGLYAAFINYSSLRIFRDLSSEQTLTFGQGLFVAIYNSLAYIVCSPIGYFLLPENKNDIKQQTFRKLFAVVGILSIFSLIAPIYAII
ncbi:Major Facilitator Superfamily (MFS), partial [Pseudoloma neurophilia]